MATGTVKALTLQFLDKTYSATYSVAANGDVFISSSDLGMSTPTGYKMASFLVWSTGAASVVVRNLSYGAPNLHNFSNTAVPSATYSVTVRYMKI